MFWVCCFILLLSVSCVPPPKLPPTALESKYTLNGSIPLDFFYVDDTNNGDATHFKYLASDIKAFLEGARKLIQRFASLVNRLDESSASVENAINFLPKSQWIQYALYLHTSEIKDAKVAVYGSMEPWLETYLLALGCGQVVTIEYNPLTYEHPNITTISKDSFDLLYSEDSMYNGYFDIIISPSAFDHDGLGRYGDPLNPDGDLEAMVKITRLLHPQHGKLFLTVPIGPDIVVFNLHRRYGEIRLPLLLQDWEIIKIYGYDARRLREPANYRQTYEPVFLLRPKKEGTTEKNRFSDLLLGENNSNTEL